jgi:hypothetical protein
VANSFRAGVDEFHPGGSGQKKLAAPATKTSLSHILLGAARESAAEWRPAVSLIEKIPTLSDEEVMNLLANARRLQTQGDEKQQAQASELIGPLEEAAAERRAARQAAIQAKRAARRPKKRAA